MKFFKHGIDVFNRRYKKYGGHTHWLAQSYIFNNKWYCIDYLSIVFEFKLHKFERYSAYYDGYHHDIQFLFVTIFWGGTPYKETQFKTKSQIRKEKIDKLL